MELELIRAGETDMEYLRFAVIDPNDGMIMVHLVSLLAVSGDRSFDCSLITAADLSDICPEHVHCGSSQSLRDSVAKQYGKRRRSV